MVKSLNTTSRHTEKGQASGLLFGLRWLFKRRRASSVSHLNERMLRDIGLADGTRSELRKVERLRRP